MRQLKEGGPGRQRGSGERRGLQLSSQLVGIEPDGAVSGSALPQALSQGLHGSPAQNSYRTEPKLGKTGRRTQSAASPVTSPTDNEMPPHPLLLPTQDRLQIPGFAQ